MTSHAQLPSTVLILAGGLGTRLRSVLPEGIPKPMATIRGKPFLEYLLDFWVSKGISEFVLSVGYRAEVIINYFGSDFKGRPIRYAREDQPLGTGGALLLATSSLKNAFFVANGDTFFDVDVPSLVAAHVENNADWTIALFRSAELDRYMGVTLNQQGQVIDFQCNEQSELLVNGGTYLVRPSVLKGILPSAEPLSLEAALLPLIKMRGGRVFGIEQKGLFIDIGIRSDYEKAKLILNQE